MQVNFEQVITKLHWVSKIHLNMGIQNVFERGTDTHDWQG